MIFASDLHQLKFLPGIVVGIAVATLIMWAIGSYVDYVQRPRR